MGAHPRLVIRHRRETLKPPKVIPLTPLGEHAPRALGTEVILGFNGPDVLSIDWRTPLSQARTRAPRHALQGNLDPGTLLATPEEVSRRTRRLVEELESRAHVMNLGHGVLPQTPVECVEAFFETVKNGAAGSRLSAVGATDAAAKLRVES